ncbi:MAG: hypothetical protein GX786_07540 [Clostridiales bacterium]|nr:hypothetical protein [Clostridiales bacterium]
MYDPKTINYTAFELSRKGFHLVVRPHPEYIKRYSARMNDILSRYKTYPSEELSFELDFTSNTSIFDSDIVITDWSGVAYEFSFVTQRPCVFINTPAKIHNSEYDKLGIDPLEFTLRDQIGICIDPNNIGDLATQIFSLLNDTSYQERILAIRNTYIANFGSSGEVGGRYLIKSIKNQIQKRTQSRQ